MLLEDHQLDKVEWTELSREIAVGVGGGCRITSVQRIGALCEVTISASAPGQVLLNAPLGNASGVWHAGYDPLRGLPADWDGREKFSAVWSLPLNVLCDVHGDAQLAIALDCMTRSGVLEYGVSEEFKSYVARFAVDEHLLAGDPAQFRLLLVADAIPYEEAIRALSVRLREGLPSRAVSEYALEPVYSTWYAFSQQIDADTIRTHGLRSRDLDCRSVFIDDGWQAFGDGRWYAGCGDWVPDSRKFPDLRASVDELHEAGLGVIAWIAPLLLGRQSAAYERMSAYAPHHTESLRAQILDPRIPEVRRHLVETCERLMVDYALDGLKIDFLNNAMVYADTPSPGDIADVGAAMTVLLGDIADAVDRVRPGALIEYRQPYVSPEIAGFADVIRANDCPADADQNRRSIVDLRLLSTDQVVHSDPIMWDPTAGTEAPARQVLNAFFAVPQVSMPMDRLPAEHVARVAELIGRWRELRDVLVRGTVSASVPGEGYPLVSSRKDGVLVAAAYQPRTLELDLDGIDRLVILNGTSGTSLPYRVVSGDPARFGLAGEGFLTVPAWDLFEPTA